MGAYRANDFLQYTHHRILKYIKQFNAINSDAENDQNYLITYQYVIYTIKTCLTLLFMKKLKFFCIIIIQNKMTTNKILILQQLQKCLEMINSFNHKNIVKTTLNEAFKHYSIKGLSLSTLKPHCVLAYIKKICANVTHTQESEIQELTNNPIDQWGNSQYKIFAWICITYAIFRDKTIKEYNEGDIAFIRHIFYRKSQNFIYFNLRRIVSSNHIDHKWTKYNDQLLMQLIRSKCGNIQSWSEISFQMFTRSQKKSFFQPHHCRQRWINHLDPSVSKEKWSQQQDKQLILKILAHGKKWAFISSSFFKGTRTQHMIKNRYNSLIRKYVRKGTKIDLYKILDKLWPSANKTQFQNFLQHSLQPGRVNTIQEQKKHPSNTNQQMNHQYINLIGHQNSQNNNNNQINDESSQPQNQEVNYNNQHHDEQIKIQQESNKENLYFKKEQQQYLNQLLF